MSEPTIEEQITFLKECFAMAMRGHCPWLSCTGDRALRHLEATIKILDSIAATDAPVDNSNRPRTHGEG
jgi:hypothetical protein